VYPVFFCLCVVAGAVIGILACIGLISFIAWCGFCRKTRAERRAAAGGSGGGMMMHPDDDRAKLASSGGGRDGDDDEFDAGGVLHESDDIRVEALGEEEELEMTARGQLHSDA
jgi:hypothetical protein